MVGNIEEPSKKRTKRSRHWEEYANRILVGKWSEEKIQEQLKFCTRKSQSGKKFSILRVSGYGRDDKSCKVRIHTLFTAYRNFNDTKFRSTGTTPQKISHCYEKIDAVLGDKPTTMLLHLISSSGTGSIILTDDRDSDRFDDELPLEDLMNATDIPVSTSKKTLAGSSRPVTGNQNESSLSNENADDKNYLGNANVGSEASCSASTD